MQVARNVYLSSEKTYTRKIYEVVPDLQAGTFADQGPDSRNLHEPDLSGQPGLWLCGGGGKPILASHCKTLSVAEAAMLAGLPKAPSAYNPINNPKRARLRQLYIIERMLENGFITAAQADAAKKEELKVNNGPIQHARPRGIRCRNGAPADLRAVRRRDVYARPQCLYHAQGNRTGRSLPRHAQGHHGL